MRDRILPAPTAFRCAAIVFACCHAALAVPVAAVAQGFFASAAAADPAKPADQLYPRGRLFPFAGFSGNAEWQKANGYTVFGPVYGDPARQRAALEEAAKAGLPYIYLLGLDMNFLGKGGKPPVAMRDRDVRAAIGKQVAEVAGRSEIAWWYVTPEELRAWVPAEMEYLGAARKAVMDADRFARPVWMYEPNHRDAGTLAITGREQDIIGKGCYVNLSGFKDDRVWVRWSVEQEVEAIKKLRRKDAVPLVMPELAKDPDAGDESLIPVWVRHDIYCGLIHGAKGVAIWSLFKRPEVSRTHAAWMEAYATVAKELTDDRALGQVFLFGEERRDLTITQVAGAAKVELALGKARDSDAEAMSAKERRAMTVRYPAYSFANRAHGSARYLFLTNDSADDISLKVRGFPRGCTAKSLFDGRPVETSSGEIVIELSRWGASAIAFTAK